jgi:two-component system chemotaxis response regulator CheB
MSSARLRVLVVEDSVTVRKRLCEVLGADPGIEVVGEAEDGKQAIERCRALRPDVITMDMMLPVMTGLAATEYVMAHFPTPILIVSSSTNRGELFRTYDALAAGAVDVLEKPMGDDGDADWERRFVAAVRLIARIRVITHPRARLGPLGRTAAAAPLPPAPAAAGPCRVVALCASTGGPGALRELLCALPSPFPVPILIVLHIGRPFGGAFAAWLDAQTGHRVQEARGGERLEQLPGRVLLAPPDRHLVVGAGGALHLSDAPPRHSCRPSVDLLLESLARECGPRALGCLLTGMGRDGAAGLLALRRAGGRTIAQDEATSVVYGMPREAVALGAAEQILALPAIAPAVAALLRAGDAGVLP